MKTTNLDEIVFRDRNKNYGAYDLRKKYDRSVILSFLGALLLVSGIVGVPLVQAMMHKVTKGEITHDIPFVIDKFIDPTVIPPPPPPPPALAPLLQKLVYSPPKIVDSAKFEVPMITIEEAMGNKNNPVTGVPEVPPGIIEQEIPSEEGVGTFFPSEPATFMNGGLELFHAWVEKNIVYPQTAIENGIFGIVHVQFAINRKGELVDIKFIRNVDKSIDEETIRVLNKSPKWVPAKQGGTPVKQLFSMPVSFVLK
jgi:protein TonB